MINIIIGWLLNFRTVTTALPQNKFIAYSRAILGMLNRGWTSKGEREMNIGRLAHLGQIILFIHHFLSRLCFLLRCLEKKKKVEINKKCIADLHFLQFVLKKCRDRVYLNAIAYRCSIVWEMRRGVNRQICEWGISPPLFVLGQMPLSGMDRSPRRHFENFAAFFSGWFSSQKALKTLGQSW